MATQAASIRFRRVSDRLKNAITPSLIKVTGKLYAAELIGQELNDEMINGRDIKSTKAASLVNELQRALDGPNSEQYLNDLCGVLVNIGERQITDIVNELITGTSTVSNSQATPHTVSTDIDTSSSTPPNNDTPAATADSTKMLEMKGKVEQQPELKEAAYVLREKYKDLEIAVLRSLRDQNIEDTKESIKVCVTKGGCKTDRQLIEHINKIENLRRLFDFLRNNNYIGYLNYKILKRLSKLIPQDDDLKKQVDDYETEYARFLNKILCHELVHLFEEYDDLSPTAPVGLPYVTFRLATSWLYKRFHTWTTIFSDFSWSEYTFLMQLRKSSVTIKYAILPCVLDKAIQDLKDPSILRELETDGITVVELPEQEKRGTTQEPQGEHGVEDTDSAGEPPEWTDNPKKYEKEDVTFKHCLIMADTDPAKVFQKIFPKLAPLIGRNFTNVTNGLFANDLITMPELDTIKTQKNLDDNQRGTEVASHLYDRIYGKKAEKDRVQCLIDICDVLESREVQNDDLKEIGASMRSTIPSMSGNGGNTAASASTSNKVQVSLGKKDQEAVIKALENALFGAAKWNRLGLALGLYQPKLTAIAQGNGNADTYLGKTIEAWLAREDGVKSTTWQTLIEAVNDTGDKAAAESIRMNL